MRQSRPGVEGIGGPPRRDTVGVSECSWSGGFKIKEMFGKERVKCYILESGTPLESVP